MSRGRILCVASYLLLLGSLSLPIFAEGWRLLGPDGGDARSFAYDPTNPDRIYLGTSTGSIFFSADGGRNWQHFAHLGVGNEYVLDHIVVDPRRSETMFVSAWNVDDQRSGDVFRSTDGGGTWAALPGMHGKSIRAFVMGVSGSNVLVAGALDGIYRSNDAGDSWERISPPNHPGIRNIESIAIDPKDPNVIYAGTWHLAWKTSDGGATWQNINKGMIDDSDVFSVIVDATNSAVVYASACSGIYKSTANGDAFQKVNGMPFAARRTRVLKQDPGNSQVVYAGTTQGLWKTVDAGKTWKQITLSKIVVNDVFVDPRNSSKLLLATDRGGVLASSNGGQSFTASNHGYAHRYVTAILADKRDPSTMFVAVANDREWGGVFSLRQGEQQWHQRSAGLGGRDVFALKQTEDGSLVAGANRGVFILDPKSSVWRSINTLSGSGPISRSRSTKNRPVENPLAIARVNAIEIKPERWLIATSEGLFTSQNQGKTWSGGPLLGRKDFVSLDSQGGLVVAATLTDVLISADGGKNWLISPAARFTNIRSVAVTGRLEILVLTHEGAFRSSDSGNTWKSLFRDSKEADLSSVWCDDSVGVLLASLSTGVILESHDGGQNWDRGPDSGYPLRSIQLIHGRLIGATLFDGVLVQE